MRVIKAPVSHWEVLRIERDCQIKRYHTIIDWIDVSPSGVCISTIINCRHAYTHKYGDLDD